VTADSAARHSFTIRPIEAEDVALLAERFSERLGAHELFVRYAREHRDGTRTSLAAWAGDSPVGFITVLWRSAYPPFAQNDVPEAMDLMVHPGSRRHGFATALLSAGEAEAARRGYPLMGLAVGLDDQYAAARRLYARLGYRHDGREPWPTEIGPMRYLTRPLRPPA
jgi:GNAT superfamily N-acetyltransferase